MYAILVNPQQNTAITHAINKLSMKNNRDQIRVIMALSQENHKLVVEAIEYRIKLGQPPLSNDQGFIEEQREISHAVSKSNRTQTARLLLIQNMRLVQEVNRSRRALDIPTLKEHKL